MSAETTDVARIQDEDILRKMWQETDDFGKKKEIRSHMYKLREARLKEFYNSSEGHTVIQNTTTTSNSDNSIKSNMSIHADNLADQSYVTLKSKEVRDSESPTRDSYNKTIAKHQDQGWTVTSSNERSQDGKTHISTHEASTSGTQQIEKGKVDYNAKLQEKAAVFQDGDDKNFTRAVETSSNSAICQEATGGDENSSFRSSTSKTSSSSRYVSESKHTNEDIQALPPTTTVIREQIPQSVINEENVRSVTERTFTSKVPYELKNHPSYVEGKTKVTQETKTLSDGTIVTTTRYETKQGNSTETATHKKYSNIASNRSEQRSSSSSTREQSSRAVSSDSQHSARNNQKAIEYIVVPEGTMNVDNTDTKSQHKDYWDTKKRESITSHQTTRNIKESALNEQVTRQSNTSSRENRQVLNDNVDYTDITPITQNVTTTKTIVTKKSVPETVEYVAIIPVPVDQNGKTTTTTETIATEHPREHTGVTYHTTATHIVDRKQDTRDTKQLVNDQFISTERRHEVDTRESVTKPQQPSQKPLQPVTKTIETQEIYTPTYSEPEKHPRPTQKLYPQPDRRQPIKPEKSELDQKSQPTEGQYDTTYRSEFTNKKISVEVSPTHDAFARSLRAVTPERITKSFPRNGSNSSLRSSPGPDKNRHPARTSPDRRDRSMSPKKSTDKFSSTETITYTTNRTSPVKFLDQKPINGDTNVRTTKTHDYNTDTFTRKSKNITTKTDTVDSNILPRKKKPRSPSPSETTTSDFEYIRNTNDISDLETSRTERTTVNRKESTRPSSLEITRKVKKVTERSPTSPLTDITSPRKSPTKEMPRKDRSPTKDSSTERPKLIRTDTYEERVKQILGLANDTKETRRTSLERHSSFEKRRSSLERKSFKRSSLRETSKRTSSDDIKARRSSPSKSPEKSYPEKQSPVKDLYTKQSETSFEKTSPLKPGARISEFPSQIRKSPEKTPLDSYPSRKSPAKTPPSVSEFPSQIRKSQEKEPLEPYPEKKSPTKTAPTVSEFPSQIRKSPEKQTLAPYPEKKSSTKTVPTVPEFPSQIRKSPEKQTLEPYPEKKSPTKTSPTVSEFPSQIRKSPEKQPLEPYPEKKSLTKTVPTVPEFPSQIRKSPEKQTLEPYPEKKSPTKTAPTVSEFPSQIGKSPEKQPLEPYPEKKSLTKTVPTVSEFPSQIKKSPEKQTLEPYPEKKSPIKTAPTVSEFPSQIRKSPEKQPLEPYPEKKSPTKTASTVSEFSSTIRRTPEREPLEPCVKKKLPKTATTVSEFPSQIKRTPEREILEQYPERKSPTKTIPTISEFPSQIKKVQEKDLLEPYPERKHPTKTTPTVSEFPSQIKRTPEREPLEPYPEKESPTKTVSYISEFPSQARRSPEKESLEPLPKKSFTKTNSKHPKKKSSRKPKTSSESSTTTEEEENDQIEERITQTKIETVESKLPISEPIAEKKIFSQLCREDEVKRFDKKKTTEELLEAEILHNQINEQKTPKKLSALPIISKIGIKKTTNVTNVIQTGTTVNKTSSIKPDKSPYKRPIEKTPSKKVIETNTYTKTKEVNKTNNKDSKSTYRLTTQPSKKQPEKIYKVEKTKFIGETEYQDKFSPVTKTKKEPVNKTFRQTNKTTLHDVEKFENIKDTTVHIRTNRVDDTVTKKKVTKTILLNGNETKTKPKVLPVRQTSPIKKSPVSVSVKPSNQTPDTTSKSNLSTQSRYSSTIKQTVIQNDNKSKQNKTTGIKKHIVTTTINVSPKTKPAVKTTGSKTVTKTRTSTSRTKELPKKVVNGYVSSDDDEDSVVESVEGSFVDLTEKRNQFTFKTTPKEPLQMFSGLEDLDNERKTRRQVITTKTVLISNEDVPDREVIVNLQRSKSSREPTPDRLCPRPLTSDEEEDSTPVRYPDQISEPDEGSLKRKPKKLSDIPIFETEDSGDHSRITEITEKKKSISKVDRVEETDESLLSIRKKINKFLNTADQLTKEPLKPKSTKVERQIFEVSDELKEDECLLSVSDKVSKFINTSEQLATSKLPDRPKSPRPKPFDEGINVNIQKKVTQFKTSVEEANRPKKGGQDPAPKMPRPDLTDVDEKLKEDECLLSVSDKVSKFISTAEKLTSTSSSKPVTLCNIDVTPTNYQDSPRQEVKTPIKLSSLKTDHKMANKDITSNFIQTEKEEEIYTRRSTSLSPERYRSPSPEFKTPTRRPSNQYTNVLNTDTVKTQTTSHEFVPTDLTPKSTHKKQPNDSSTVLSGTSKLRSTDSIKKAKALFEKVGDNTDTRQRDILSRPSVFDGKRTSRADKLETINKSSIQKLTDDNLKTAKLVETISRRSQSPQKSPERYTTTEKVEITRFRASSPEKIPDIVTSKPRSREPSPQGDMPHYMKPLDRSLRPNSPHRDHLFPTNPQQTPPSEQEDTRPTKFGVTLRRTDSGRTSKTIESSTLTSERRKSSITLEKRITEEEIEEIFELDVLEELLEKIIGYDLRRKIRTQIRLVKKLISENTLEEYIIKRKYLPREPITRRGSSPSKTSKSDQLNKTTDYQTSYTRKVSPERTTVDKKLFEHTDIVDRRSSFDKTTEYQSSYSFNERRSSTECTKLTKKSTSPVRESKSPRRLSPERNVSRKVDITPTGKVTTVKTTEVTPSGLKTTTTKTTESKTFTTLKKTAPSTKKYVEDIQPEWVRQRNLKNIRDNTVQTSKKVSSTTTTRKSSLRTSPAKEVKGTDIITSSYGVGPTDENGAPLFGLKALRAQNGNDKTKVQGTVIRSQYYSENDQEPVGEVSVTKYSTDPTDLEQDGVIHTDGKIASVTTTQKFGYKDTPSLRTLTDNKKEICDTSETLTTKSTKLNRRGSVKEISKKFIDNAVETLKSERQTTYPKAGLILRTSSFKSSNGDPHSRETSPDEDRETESRETVTVRTMKKSKGGETFLTNTSRVSGVQDVITRMKTEEYEEGDTEEDIAARGLLNRFIGSQVILSGMEERASSARSKTTESISPSGTVRKSTTVTTTVTEGGKPTTTTKVFQRPVTEREIETVWDEQTLRLLLDQSTDYEERRIIRARLRQLMAEQEACTALVDDATKSEGSPTPTTPTIPGHLEERVEVSKESSREGDVTTTKVTQKVTQQQVRGPKPMSPFAKFRQLDKQNSVNKPTPPSTPGTPRGSGPLFKFTDPALTQSANTIKERLLHWCRMKTKEYENIQLDNFSSSWADGLAFCALIHHFLPEAFDYKALTPKDRRHNFELAFRIAEEKADIFPLLDVEDMLETRRPDWKCVFTYVQAIYRRFKDD